MAITIGSNIASLLAQRQLSRSSSELATANLRLASGSRINSAVDDAAGLAISSMLNADRRVFTQGIRNLNDGLSYLLIADNAVAELAGIVIRQRELATQATNGTYGTKQREALDKEAQALSAEYFRIARTTSFNGIKLFDGSVQQVTLQGGYGTMGSISSSLGGKMEDGTFKYIGVFPSTVETEIVLAGDIDADGKVDLVTGGDNQSYLRIFLGNGDGTFKAPSTVASATIEGARSVILSDLDGDTKLDLVVAKDSAADLLVIMGNGDGSFKPATTYIASGPLGQLGVADINGDNVQDLVVNARGGNEVNLFLGNGNGSFVVRQTVSTPTNGNTTLNLGDMNGDGKVDIVNRTGTSLHVLLGNGNGTFLTGGSYAVGNELYTSSGQIADINSDGIMDFLAVDQGDSTFSILLGNGDGTLKARNIYAAGDRVEQVASHDFNADGILDIVAANPSWGSSKSMMIFQGNGDGTFLAPTSYSSVGADVIAITDVDLDGFADLAVGDYSAQRIGIYLANTREGIGPQQGFSLATRYGSLQSLSQFDQNLDRLSQQRATIGAFTSRITSAIATLITSQENYAAAESRIKDTDVAQDTAILIRQRILQQVAASVLAQANQMPDIALKLLS